jgi:hypothetical protein
MRAPRISCSAALPPGVSLTDIAAADFDEAAAHDYPRVGMSVQYKQGETIQAAIITRVHSRTSVNLRVFGDDSAMPTHAVEVLHRAAASPDNDWWELP